MSLLHADGFDWVPTAADSALLADRYALVDAGVVIDDSLLNVTWVNGVTSSAPDQALRVEIDAVNPVIVGFHYNPLALSARTILRLLSSGSVQGSLKITADGRIEAYKADGVTLIEQSGVVLTAGQVAWVEMKYYVDADVDTGFVVVGVDDVVAIRVRADTKGAAGSTIDAVELNLSADDVVDDWIIKDTSGSDNNDYGGEAYVELTQITSEQAYGYTGGSFADYQWTNSDSDSIDNNTYINEVPTTAPDDDTTYVHDNGISGQRDTHIGDFSVLPDTLGAPANSYDLVAVAVLYRARREVDGTQDLTPHIFHAGSNSRADGDALSIIGTSYLYYQAIFPHVATGADWTTGLYDESEFGYKLP